MYPVSGPPVEDAGLWIEGGNILDCGPFADVHQRSGGSPLDLGEVIVMPGWVNAHCHLDYTGFARQIPPPSSFTSWIQQLIALKAGWGYTEFAESWLLGLRQLIDTGVTSLGNIEAVPELLPDTLPLSRIRISSFLEIITLRNRWPAGEAASMAELAIERASSSLHRSGLAPHAPYTTTQELIQQCASIARRREWRWTLHLAESSEEQSLFLHQSGPLYDWLRKQRDMSDTGKGSAVQWLLDTGCLGPELVLAHVNVVSHPEAKQLAEAGSHVVHCPRSHEYFQHPTFPLDMLTRAGVNIALGTDSLASVIARRGVTPTLDMFAEARALSDAHPAVSPERIISMGTAQGAAALGYGTQVGSLRAGSFADLAVIPWNGPVKDSADAILSHSGPVAGCMAAGNWLRGPIAA